MKKTAKVRKENKKLNNKGFTLAELLLATIILLFATQLIAESIQLASKSYITSLAKSEAQMISSTLSDFIRGELTTASDVIVGSGGEIDSFIDESGRLGGRCKFTVDEGMLALKATSGEEYFPVQGKKVNGTPVSNYVNDIEIDSFSATSDGKGKYDISFSLKRKGVELASSKFTVYSINKQPE